MILEIDRLEDFVNFFHAEGLQYPMLGEFSESYQVGGRSEKSWGLVLSAVSQAGVVIFCIQPVVEMNVKQIDDELVKLELDQAKLKLMDWLRKKEMDFIWGRWLVEGPEALR
jgi:hypothetical protein